PVSNFRSGKRPKNPGAWIIKNSWGTGVGDGGYYYISYEDSASYIEDVFFYDAEPIDNYDNIYQYDGTTNFNSDNYYAQGSSLATVFTSFGEEDLKAVSIATWDEEVSYELKVFLNPNTSDPTSGELKASKTGVLNYGGYQTIPLDSPVRLSMGDRYSVVFTLTTEEGEIMLPVDIVGNYSASDWGLSYVHALHESSCFVNESGSWIDKSSLYNLRMKAYTDDVPEDPVSVETTFHVNAGAPPAPLSGTAGVTEITLPAPETVPDGWSFSGWALQPVSATTEKPVLYTAGSTFRLTARISDLYAVYEKTESDPGSAELRIVDSFNVGDTLYLVSEDAKTELSAISSTNTKYGIGSSYSDLPSKVFPLVVENGTESGSYAFKNGSNYLTWVTGNSLSLSSSVTAGSSWTVAFDADKNASIKNKADEARVIWWNVRSPRFAAYTNKSEGADFYCTQFYKYGAASTTTYDSYPNGNYMIGDLDDNKDVTPNDALLLIYHVFFPSDYTVSQPTDYNHDGVSDEQDAFYLMYHISFPELYPLE
ncbi:MAG: hypothetical protein IK088_04960, partial [Lachnospiraceae bacterium]|nr:hypothetical protein [Lachnospiraceae bacterium]